MKNFALTILVILFTSQNHSWAGLKLEKYHERYKKEKTVQGKALVVEAFLNDKDFDIEVDSFFLVRLPVLIEDGLRENNRNAANVARLALALNYRIGNDIDQALLLLNEIGDFFYKSDQLKNHFYKVQFTVILFNLKGLYRESLDQIAILERLKKYLGNWVNLIAISNIKADALAGLKKYNEAEKEAQKYLKSTLRINRAYLISEAYSKLGTLAQMKVNFELASAYYMKAAEYAYRGGAKVQIGNAKTCLAIVEFLQGNNESAKDMFLQAVEAARVSNSPVFLCKTLYNMGVFYYDTGKLKEALPYFSEMLETAKKLGLLESQIEGLTEFANIYGDLKESEKAIEYYKKLIEAKNVLQAKSLTESKKFYEEFAMVSIRDEKLKAELKEDELLEQLDKASKKSYILMIILLGTIVGMTLVLMRQKKVRVNSTAMEQ